MHLPNPMPAFARNAMATRFEIVLPGHSCHAVRAARFAAIGRAELSVLNARVFQLD